VFQLVPGSAMSKLTKPGCDPGTTALHKSVTVLTNRATAS
jgi:hypothetical protein